MVRFIRSMNDVFNVDESSELLSLASNRHGRAHPLSSFDLNDAIVSSRLEHLAVENRWTKDATDDILVEIKSVGDDQGTGRELHARRDVAHERPRVSVASPPDDGRRPETRPHLNRRKNPRGPRLPTDERADLVGLKLFDDEAGNSNR